MIANLRFPTAVLAACSAMLTIMPATSYSQLHKNLSATAAAGHILYVDAAAAGGNGSS